MMKSYYVYTLTNKPDNLYYVGVTNDLIRRVHEHKNKIIEGFTSKYNINILVYYEIYDDIEKAILREKELKDWRREKKRRLILSMNPRYVDLWDSILE